MCSVITLTERCFLFISYKMHSCESNVADIKNNRYYRFVPLCFGCVVCGEWEGVKRVAFTRLENVCVDPVLAMYVDAYEEVYTIHSATSQHYIWGTCWAPSGILMSVTFKQETYILQNLMNIMVYIRPCYFLVRVI